MPTVCAAIVLCTLAGARASQAATCDGHDTTVLVENTTLVEGHTLLEGGDPRNPTVVLFHELPGLTHHDQVVGARLVCEGFHVYMPLLFGARGDDNQTAGRHVSCDEDRGPLFWCTQGGREHPIITAWVRDAVKKIGAGARPIAVIGMCLTGTFALSLAQDANVAVAVMAQPTLSFWFWNASSLDLPDATLRGALAALAQRQAGVFLVRARFDFISAPEKIDRLTLEIGRTRPTLNDVYVRQVFTAKHSVLTMAAPDPDSSVMRDLLLMLRQHLTTP